MGRGASLISYSAISLSLLVDLSIRDELEAAVEEAPLKCWTLKMLSNVVVILQESWQGRQDYLVFSEFRIFLLTLTQYLKFYQAFNRLKVPSHQIRSACKVYGWIGLN